MKFSNILKKLRKEKGVSIKKMAEELGINYTYISKLENSKGNPSSEVVEKISHYFNYNSDELMLSAGKIPDDIAYVLQNNPKEASIYLRSKFGGKRKHKT